MRDLLKRLMVLTALAGFALPASAQKGTIDVKSEVMKEVTVAGGDGTKESKTVPATHVVPGNEVIFVTTIRNIGTAPAEKLVVNNPVPAELIYAGANSGSGEALLSIDGKTFDHLENLLTSSANGTSQPATAGDVHFLRWTLSGALKPGETAIVSYRAVVK